MQTFSSSLLQTSAGEKVNIKIGIPSHPKQYNGILLCNDYKACVQGQMRCLLRDILVCKVNLKTLRDFSRLHLSLPLPSTKQIASFRLILFKILF